ncbi:MAG: hypothetical protein ACRENE_22810, partial [Polyangiaceae bacterium]
SVAVLPDTTTPSFERGTAWTTALFGTASAGSGAPTRLGASSATGDASSEAATEGGASPSALDASAIDGPDEAPLVDEAGDVAPTPACPGAQRMCAGQCTAIATDANNCGACGQSCAPGTCSGGTCQPWVVTASYSSSFGCDGTDVAWAQPTIIDVLEAPADGSGAHSGSWLRISRSSGNGDVYGVSMMSGVTAWTVTDPGGNGNALIAAIRPGAPGNVIQAGFGAPTGIALDSGGGYAYFGTVSGSSADIWQCSLVAASPPCVSLASFTSSRLGSVAVDDQFVYWTDPGNGLVSRKALAEGNVTTLASGQGALGAIVVDDSSIYWTATEPSKTVVRLMSKGSSGSAVVVSNPGGISALATDGSKLFFATADGVIQSLPATGAQVVTLYSIAGAVSGYPPVSNLVFAGGSLFWNDQVHSQIAGLRLP